MLKVILVMLLVLAWVPLSLHCQIESLPGMEFLACDPSHEAAPQPSSDCSDCADNFCQVVESGHYKTEEQTKLLPQPDWIPLSLETWLELAAPAAPQLTLAVPLISPPKLRVAWQFMVRAALPIRAPSFAS